MNRLLLCLALFYCFVEIAFSAPEMTEHGDNDQTTPSHRDPGAQHDHPEGADNYAFDHEVFLGSRSLAQEFMSMHADEARDRLLVLVQEMDADKNGVLSKDELIAALMKNFLALDQEEALDKMDDFDDNQDHFVDWPEYVKNTYHINVEKLDELLANETAQASDPHAKSTARLYRNDQLRFKLADRDNDGKLTVVEFTAFTHPYDFDYMAPAEVKHTIETYDQDNDGKISLAEFLHEDQSGGDADWRKTEEERFTKDLDKNKDGYLDDEEVRQWISPSLASSAADEAAHLMKMVDSDDDGSLSHDEIVVAYQILVGGLLDEIERDEL